MSDFPFVITDATGGILERFEDQQERDEALLTGEYGDDAEPAYVNEPDIDWDSDPDPGPAPDYRDSYGNDYGWQDSTFPNEY